MAHKARQSVSGGVTPKGEVPAVITRIEVAMDTGSNSPPRVTGNCDLWFCQRAFRTAVGPLEARHG